MITQKRGGREVAVRERERGIWRGCRAGRGGVLAGRTDETLHFVVIAEEKEH